MLFVVTGGIGFIGSWYCEHILATTDARVLVVDKLTYCASKRTVDHLARFGCRFTLLERDMADPSVVSALKREIAEPFVVLHFAAESSVDISLVDPMLVCQNNVLATMNVLELARQMMHLEGLGLEKLIYISTDEVYGEQLNCTESTPLMPTTPYSASKACGDMMVSAFATTYKIPVNVVRCSNVFGPRQYPEKIVPLVCTNLASQPVQRTRIHGTGEHKRRYLYVADAIAAIEMVRLQGEPGEVYNIGPGEENELTTLEIVRKLASSASSAKVTNHAQLIESVDPATLVSFIPDRLHNDARYSMDCAKIRQLGWSPTTPLNTALKACIEWYADHLSYWS